jgi:hypothetical protein
MYWGGAVLKFKHPPLSHLVGWAHGLGVPLLSSQERQAYLPVIDIAGTEASNEMQYWVRKYSINYYYNLN